MYADYADYTDGNDLSRLADDGCPHDVASEVAANEAVEVRGAAGNNDARRG